MLTRLGLCLPSLQSTGRGRSEDFSLLAATARAAERAGFDSLWLSGPPQTLESDAEPAYFGYEAYTLLGALALRTSRAMLGTLGLDANGRHPSVLAKQVTALDVLSSGRAFLGIGPSRAASDAIDRFEETIDICRSMFRGGHVHFDGRFYKLRGATNRPGPVQEGGPPILIDASGQSYDRTGLLKLVARHADGVVVTGDVTEVANMAGKLRSLGIEAGSNRSPLSVILLATLVVGDSLREAQQVAEGLGGDGLVGLPGQAVIAGDQNTVSVRVDEYLRAGIDGVVVRLPDAQNLRHVAIAGEVLGRVLAGGVSRG